MSLWRIVFRSLRLHLFSSLVTGFSIALAASLVMAVWSIKDQAGTAFQQSDGGFDAVLGARSSALQLVLNAVFHLEASPGNLPWAEYEKIKKNSGLRSAIPISMGDNYRGFRVVGTIPEMFQGREYAPGKSYRVRPPGRLFDPTLKEAVIGSFVADKLNLKPGDHFHPYHGLTHAEGEAHEDEYLVVGVLEPSNTPADRVLWIPLEGLQLMSGHARETATELSAVLLKFQNPISGKMLEMEYNKKGKDYTLAWPIGLVVAQLFNRLVWIDQVLRLVAYLVALVAIGSVASSIYNSMNERRRQIAIFRALGARRSTIFFSVLLEAVAITTLGVALAYLFYGLLLTGVSRLLRSETGVFVDPFQFHPALVVVPLAMILLSALAGMVPAWKGYRMPVAENLSPQ